MYIIHKLIPIFSPLIYKQQKLITNTSNFETKRLCQYDQLIHEIEALRLSKFRNAQLTGSGDIHGKEPNLDFLDKEIQKSQPKIAGPPDLNNQTKNGELDLEMDMESAFHMENLHAGVDADSSSGAIGENALHGTIQHMDTSKGTLPTKTGSRKKTTRPTKTKPSAHVETPLSKVGHKRKNVDLWQDNTELDVDTKKRAKTEKAVDALLPTTMEAGDQPRRAQ